MVKIKRHRVKTRRKNPPPFFKELANLLDKKVTVQFGSENGVFQLTNILEESGILFQVSYEDKNYRLNIKFNWMLIDKIIGNIIFLHPLLLRNKLSKLNEIYDPFRYIGRKVKIVPNITQWQEAGIQAPTSSGILHYHKRSKKFYMQKLHHFFISFDANAVYAILDLAGKVDILIQI